MSAVQTRTDAVVSTVPRGIARKEPVGFRATTSGRLLVRTFRISASLQLAIVLLTTFTFWLIVATLLESAYSARIAREVVYDTWWFTLLLCLLAVNILCAALKKYPWKRHQTGFLITHVGLLVLVFGGLLTNLGGVEGQMMMIDSDNAEIQNHFRLANRADTIQIVNRHQLEVYRVPKETARHDALLLKQIVDVVNGGVEMQSSLRDRLAGHHWNLGLAPGAFAWHNDEHFKAELPTSLRFLSFVANPMRSWSRTLDSKAQINVENYYPHTERWPYSPATDETEDAFPALQLKLTTPMTPRPMKRWVTSLPNFEPDATPVGFELFVLHDRTLLPEFLEPPSAKEMGKNGVLVVALGEPRGHLRVSLDTVKEGDGIDLKGTGLRFTLKKRGELLELAGKKPEGDVPPNSPSFPAVQFELSNGKETGTYLACARLPNMAAFRSGTDVAAVTTWYHYPDFRWGQASRMGAIQFLKTDDGKVYYRVYGKEGIKGKGKELDTGEASAVDLPFKPMDMRMEVLTWMPEAQQRDNIVPRQVRPGSEPSERFEPAVRCTLECNGEKKEFWVRMSRTATQVNVGKEIFFFRYRNDMQNLDWDLKLVEARQVSDPGTNRPASFESDVVLNWKEGGESKTREQRISMNNTLDHAGFKVYQTNYRPMTNMRTGEVVLDTEGKLVSMSGFTVADDPGLFCKYLGSLLLVLGIGVMFWMRAYFFKPRRVVT